MKSEIFKNFCEICALRILFLNFLRIKRDEMMADQIDKGSIVTNADANANACDEAELAIEDSDPNPVYNSNLFEFIEFFSSLHMYVPRPAKGYAFPAMVTLLIITNPDVAPHFLPALSSRLIEFFEMIVISKSTPS